MLRGWLMNGAAWPTVRNSSCNGSPASTPSSSSIQLPPPVNAAFSAVNERSSSASARTAATRPGSSSSARPRLITRMPAGRLCTWLSSGTTWPLAKISRRAIGPPRRCGLIVCRPMSTLGASAIATLVTGATLVYFHASARVVGMPCALNRAKLARRQSRRLAAGSRSCTSANTAPKAGGGWIAALQPGHGQAAATAAAARWSVNSVPSTPA